MKDKETLEEAKKYLSNEGYGKGSNFTLNNVADLMIEWEQEQNKNKYSEEEVRNIIFKFSSYFDTKRNIEITLEEQKQWFKQFKKK
jgi:CRISPR/Cas system-associated protein Cas10 (large subunit of type III CRISPR-Cas system)